jgi:bifunctional DNA-binding transcriptional regulator/antitoxin component of YhaV-PrlF toxin-antitoxin module
MNNTWTVTCIEDENGDTVLPFPAEMMSAMDWREGDVLDFDMRDDESCHVINLTWKERQPPGNVA